MAKVVVTGGSGFIGGRCILQLLEAGHEVRTTVRSLGREAEVRAAVAAGGWSGPASRLVFTAADLEADGGWAEAVKDADFVLHVASPFPSSVPKDPDALIRPARDGTLRVLRASRDAGVKRVVLTSSVAAIAYGHAPRESPFNEGDWTNLESREVAPYARSKTLAERAAWDFVKAEGGALELSVVNPVGVFGPVLSGDFSTSILLVQRLLDGAVPGLPDIFVGAVDVRDVADLHLRAMTDPAAKGERFIALSGDYVRAVEIARILKSRLGPDAALVPTRRLPNLLVRLVALADPAVGQIVPELGRRRSTSAEKARLRLGWTPRSAEDAIEASARSLIARGLLKRRAPAAA